MEEIWLPIENNEGYYISNSGKIKSFINNRHGFNVNYKILKPGVSNGYYIISLGRGNMKRVHRLVAEAFIPNPFKLPQVNHKNGIRSDNRVENLEWCNNQQNNQHSFNMLGRTSTWSEKRGKDHCCSKKLEQYDMSDKLVKVWDGVSECARITGFSVKSISNCARGKSKTSSGFKWKYVENIHNS